MSSVFILKNKKKLKKEHEKLMKFYNIESNIKDWPDEYPCIAKSYITTDVNGHSIRYMFIYKDLCKKILSIIKK